MKELIKIIFIIPLVFVINTGIAGMQEIDISVKSYQIPILKGEAHNPLLRIEVDTEGKTKLKSIEIEFHGSTVLDDIKLLGVYSSGSDTVFKSKELIKTWTDVNKTTHIDVDLKIEKGKVYLWITLALTDDANLLNQLNLAINKVSFSNGNIIYPKSNESTQYRYGLALRHFGQDGVHTSRIPGLATSKQGTLMAIYDARRDMGRDLQGDIDIGLNRSFDNGNTWESMQVVMDMGKWGGLPEKFNGVSDANILVKGSDIYIIGLWMHGVITEEGKWLEGLNEESLEWNHQWKNRGSQAGFDEKQTSQFLIVKSSDDGKTWSKPINLTKMCKRESWWLWAPAPGRGIVMNDGTLVFPTQGRDENGLPFSNITFSKDNGQTWQTSNPASHNTTENSVVELDDGLLMLNIRDNRNRENKSSTNGRAVFTTSNMGKSWEEHPTSHGDLIEPVCMAGLFKHQYNAEGVKKEVLLFSNPNSKYQRINISIKMSFDNGATWPEGKWILLDEGKGRGYSCITSIDDNIIGILYEGSRTDLIFQKIDISKYLK